MTAFQD